MQRRGTAEPPVSPVAWPVPVAGAIAASWAAVASLLSLAVVFSVLWVFTADPRSTLEAAVRSAAALWLLAHSVSLSYASVTVSLTPLLITAILVWVISVATRWSVRNTIVLNLGGGLALLGSIAGCYALLGGIVSLWLSPVVRINSSRALLGCFGWALVGAALGLWKSRNETGPIERRTFNRAGERTVPRIRVQSPANLFGQVWQSVPGSVRLGMRLAVRVMLGWLAIATVAAIGLVIWRASSAWDLLSTLAPDWVQRTELLVAVIAFLPTLIGWQLCLLVGPGIAIGGGSMSLLSQQGEVLPPFPLFALLPIPLPGWAPVLWLLPVTIAAVASQSLVARRMWAAGLSYVVVLAAMVAGLVGVTRGDFGAGRMAAIGGQPLVCGLAAAAIAVLGGAIAGASNWIRSRNTTAADG